MAEQDLILAALTAIAEPNRVEGEVGPLTTNRDGRLRVASKPGFFDPVSGVLTASGQTLVADVTDASNVMLHIRNSGSASMSAGAFVFEGSLDSTDGSDGTWFVVQAVRSDSNTIETGRGTSSLSAGAGQLYAWELSVNAIRWFRIRCSTTLTTNAQALWTIIRGTYATEPIPAMQTHGVTVTNPSGSAISVTSVSGLNASIQKSSAGSLHEISASNPTATACFLKFFNKSTSPTMGTDIPVIIIPVPPNSFVTYEFGAIGKRFTSGIAMAITANQAALDTNAAVAGVYVHGTYV